MEVTKAILEFLAALAWPLIVLVIALLYRRPLYTLLEHIGGIAQRARTEPFEVAIGEKLKVVFARALAEANPKSVAEAVQVARETADRALALADILSEIPLKKHERDPLLKIADAGPQGLVWRYGGDPTKTPGRTMGALLRNGLVRKADDDRYVVHPVVSEFFFGRHWQEKETAQPEAAGDGSTRA